MSRDGTLPPGIEHGDLPGNTAEDEAWDRLWEDVATSGLSVEEVRERLFPVTSNGYVTTTPAEARRRLELDASGAVIVTPEEGDPCPLCQRAHMEFPEVVGCTCHLGHPPCSACTSNPLTCPRCGWELPQ